MRCNSFKSEVFSKLTNFLRLVTKLEFHHALSVRKPPAATASAAAAVPSTTARCLTPLAGDRILSGWDHLVIPSVVLRALGSLRALRWHKGVLGRRWNMILGWRREHVVLLSRRHRLLAGVVLRRRVLGRRRLCLVLLQLRDCFRELLHMLQQRRVQLLRLCRLLCCL